MMNKTLPEKQMKEGHAGPYLNFSRRQESQEGKKTGIRTRVRGIPQLRRHR